LGFAIEFFVGDPFGVGVAFGFGVADVTSCGGSAETGTNALVGDGMAVCAGVVGAGVGLGVLRVGGFALGAEGEGCASTGAGRTGSGVAPGLLTVVDDPAGTDTSAPPALVSTVPEIVTTVVSPFGATATYESDPARITDAIPALRTS
jgi:hypothetical protein